MAVAHYERSLISRGIGLRIADVRKLYATHRIPYALHSTTPYKELAYHTWCLLLLYIGFGYSLRPSH